MNNAKLLIFYMQVRNMSSYVCHSAFPPQEVLIRKGRVILLFLFKLLTNMLLRFLISIRLKTFEYRSWPLDYLLKDYLTSLGNAGKLP